ncbi:hypothetical protein CEUSTIGMA_g13372.t1 [Chlamydomonas eustigma]|uniref:Protein kinase domain-containing protein n=1 Tax=Chlamydomonas eustigma TaxID=1157962 RepID=A0A250XSE6_9CHLO|nr:hypothetical protein CEUSTIGMA_g13372.t1 [Chlamydomonas eustigma]|eukprot:GAX85956.1 hypothetical protein CEUSTIGMA_g13372.t1 [Chlamydomonas eustigma]
MELADGGDLFNKKAQFEGRTMMALEQNVVQRVILPLLGALDYLHTRGIMHRDVKLENILLSKSTAAIKLADFGLSIDSLRERPVTRVGTTEYMAPEILECPIKDYPEENKDRWDLAYDQSVDVWALGILAYELLQGQCPKDKDYVSQKVKNPQTLNLPKMLCFPTRMSPQAEDFISQILQKEASKRPSCEALLGHPWIAAFIIPSRPRLLTSLVFKDAGERHSPPVVFSTGQTNCTQHNPFNALVVGANKAGANNASSLSGLDYERNYVSKEASYRRLDRDDVLQTKGLRLTAVKISSSSGPRTQPPARDRSQQKYLQIRRTLSMMNTSAAGTTKASLGKNDKAWSTVDCKGSTASTAGTSNNNQSSMPSSLRQDNKGVVVCIDRSFHQQSTIIRNDESAELAAAKIMHVSIKSKQQPQQRLRGQRL